MHKAAVIGVAGWLMVSLAVDASARVTRDSASSTPRSAPTMSSSAQTQRATSSRLVDFEGPVVSVNPSRRTFRVRAHEQHRVVQITAVRSTRYEGLSGFSALRVGRRVDVHARRSGGRWIAVKIEPYSP